MIMKQTREQQIDTPLLSFRIPTLRCLAQPLWAFELSEQAVFGI